MHVVDLTPVYSQINEALLLLLGGLVLWASTWVRSWLQAHARFLDEKTQAQLADGLNRALSNGVAIAMQRGVEELEHKYPGIPVKSQLAYWAVDYAVEHSAPAIDKFGLNPSQLAIKALAYLPPAPTLMGDGTIAASPAPVVKIETHTLPPVA